MHVLDKRKRYNEHWVVNSRDVLNSYYVLMYSSFAGFLDLV